MICTLLCEALFCYVHHIDTWILDVSYFADNISKRILLTENISMRLLVPRGPNDNESASVQHVTWSTWFQAMLVGCVFQCKWLAMNRLEHCHSIWSFISLLAPGKCNSTLLTYWGRVTHLCVTNLITIGSENDLSPNRRQPIIWTNAGTLT